MLHNLRQKLKSTKSMVRIANTTYRIKRTTTGMYEVTRILDDELAGAFILGPPIVLTPGVLETPELYAIARAAIQNAMTGFLRIRQPWL